MAIHPVFKTGKMIFFKKKIAVKTAQQTAQNISLYVRIYNVLKTH